MSACQPVEPAPRDPDVQARVLGVVQAGESTFSQGIQRGQTDGSIRSTRGTHVTLRVF